MSRAKRGTLALISLVLVAPTPVAYAKQPKENGTRHRVERLEAENARLKRRLEAIEKTLEEVHAVLRFVRVQPDSINGLAGPHWIIEGANVHVRSGSGETADGCSLAAPECQGLTGLGNLVVGYNDVDIPRFGLPDLSRRTGSHNLIVGSEHRYTSFGGVVAGNANVASGGFASVIGGSRNEASGNHASVTGGSLNEARGDSSSVSGGAGNRASGFVSSISGGSRNEASGFEAAVSGGAGNEARGDASWVSGGFDNLASGVQSSVSAGILNEAAGTRSSVSGGSSNLASGFTASISGGFTGEASGSNASISGGFGNLAEGDFSSVSGGRERVAPNAMNWAAGGLQEPN